MKRVIQELRENQAATNPQADDRRLAGRTYAIPFDDVWRASLELCEGGLKGWSVLSADDQRGVIEAVSKTPLTGREDDVRVAIQLDENAQTRVDLWSASQRNRATLGRNRRIIGHFLKRLDRRLGATPDQILDPTAAPAWLEPADSRRRACGRGPPVHRLRERCARTRRPGLGRGGARRRRKLLGPHLRTELRLRHRRGRQPLPRAVADGGGGDAGLCPAHRLGVVGPRGAWEEFYEDSWGTPPGRAPNRVVPHGSLAFVVREENSIDGIIYEEGMRSLELSMGDVRASWVGPRGEGVEILNGQAYLSDQRTDGVVLDLTRGGARGSMRAGTGPSCFRAIRPSSSSSGSGSTVETRSPRTGDGPTSRAARSSGPGSPSTGRGPRRSHRPAVTCRWPGGSGRPTASSRASWRPRRRTCARARAPAPCCP